ncbi:nitroreductase [Streptomyces sp. NEAU-YJ-81]|uniref:nitroreductase n=1 Tax=Streptomyces sp. NEAU-YJ-81 TaxID=2820288 RepID=UPI001ABD3E2F|nr:nitroreductase [Streptomyces sp. NEAU-YJ-81]MBO3674431.1 nitroreductase [Streptomyces sp. NEAU-YJ-81]
MDVYEAVNSRQAVRAFSDEPVHKEVLARVLAAATRAPSSGNLQPWHAYVLAGEPLAELKRRATARVLAGDPGDEREYPIYPAELTSPYLDRFSAAAAQRHDAMGIERNDPDRSVKLAALNAEAFGAPVVLFCYLDRTMGPGQWADAGMYVQTVMLLLRAEGLHSCPQVFWSMYRKTVSQMVGADDGLELFCGVSMGFEKEGVSRPRTGRADMAETVSFLGV